MKTRKSSAAAAGLALALGLCGTARAWDGAGDKRMEGGWDGLIEEIKGGAGSLHFALRDYKEPPIPAPAVKGVAAQAPEIAEKEFDAEAKAAIAKCIEAEEGNGAYAVLTALRVDPPPMGYHYTHAYEARVVLTTFAGPDRSGGRSDLVYKYFGFYDAASKEASVAKRELAAPYEGAVDRMRELVAEARAEGSILRFIREVSLEKDFLRRPRLKLLAQRPKNGKERDKFELAVDWNFSCDSSWHCDPEDRPMMGFGIGYRIEYARD